MEKEPPGAFLLYPDDLPPERFIARDKKKMNRTIDLGYRKTEAQMDRIRDFLA